MESLRNILILLALSPFLALAGEAPYAPSPDGAVSFGGPPSFPSNIWSEEHPGFALQSGYEGYLVPAETLSVKDIIKTAGFVAAVPVLAKAALKIIVKVAIGVIALGAVVGIGLLLTWALCACTPVCHLTFHKFDKWHKFDRESVRGFLSSDRLNTAADLLNTAITKYNDLNKKTDVATN